MTRMSTIGGVAKRAWSDINDARGRGETLDGAYVTDVGNLNLLTIMAGVDIAHAAVDRRMSVPDAEEKLDAAEKLLAKLVESGRMPKAEGAERAAR
jgi:hypothetical protein